MKKIRIVILFLICSFVFMPFAKAACDVAKKVSLNREINDISVNYEILKVPVKGEPDIYDAEDGDGYYFYTDEIQINIINLTKDFSVEIKNDYDKKKVKYTYNDFKDGVLTIKSPTIEKIVNYNIKVYTSKDSGCSEKDVTRTIYFTQPRYNHWSQYAICDKIPEYSLCKPYVNNYDDVSYDEFFKKTEEVLKEKVKKEEEEQKEYNKWYNVILRFVNEHKTAFIIAGGAVAVGAVAGVTTVIIKRRRDVI